MPPAAFRDRMAELGFRWRQAMRWSAPAWKWRAGSLASCLAPLSPEAQVRGEALARRHDLGAWPRLLSRIELHENLYTLDLLERHLPGLPPGPALDVGSKNGSLLPALCAAWPHPWDLVELDAHRRYPDLSTRRAHGERLAAAFPGCRYLAGSVEAMPGPYALVTWFLPFVHEEPLRAWGLPRRFFQPEALLRHVTSLVQPGGALFVVNQGEAEHDTQHRLFRTLDLDPQILGRLNSPLSPFHRPRYGLCWQRPG
jgi:hypothetical protein